MEDSFLHQIGEGGKMNNTIRDALKDKIKDKYISIEEVCNGFIIIEEQNRWVAKTIPQALDIIKNILDYDDEEDDDFIEGL